MTTNEMKPTDLLGDCATCGREMRLTKTGLVWRHGAKDRSWPPRDCDGSGRKPREASAG